MDQQKCGGFIRTLRQEKKLTQEQLAERLGVSNRSVSRWENGNNLPDLDLLVALARTLEVEVGELLDGERKTGGPDGKAEETLAKVADYTNLEKTRFIRQLRWMFLAGLASLAVCLAIELLELPRTPAMNAAKGFFLGIASGAQIVELLFLSRYGAKLRAAKMRLLELFRDTK